MDETLSTLDVLKLIIDKEMNMPENRVWAYNSDVDLPKDNDLFIILFLKEQIPFANNTKYVSTTDGMEEHQTINIREEITISLVSRSTQARTRAYEVLLALNSLYSRQIQAKNKIHISILGNFYDASWLEATSMLNRWDLRIRVLRAYDNIRIMNSDEYYDKYRFQTVIENKGGYITTQDFNYPKEGE